MGGMESNDDRRQKFCTLFSYCPKNVIGVFFIAKIENPIEEKIIDDTSMIF